MNAFRWTRSREMRTAERRPLVRMYSAPEPAMVPQRYPSTEDARGWNTADSIELWLIGKGWPGGTEATRMTVFYLLFLRWKFEADFVARGGVIR